MEAPLQLKEENAKLVEEFERRIAYMHLEMGILARQKEELNQKLHVQERNEKRLTDVLAQEKQELQNVVQEKDHVIRNLEDKYGTLRTAYKNDIKALPSSPDPSISALEDKLRVQEEQAHHCREEDAELLMEEKTYAASLKSQLHTSKEHEHFHRDKKKKAEKKMEQCEKKLAQCEKKLAKSQEKATKQSAQLSRQQYDIDK